jgi:trehalose synthase
MGSRGLAPARFVRHGPSMKEVELSQREIRQLEPYLGAAQVQQAIDTAARVRNWLDTRVIWNISSTAVGGGVAEMLAPLLGYSRSLGLSIRWLVMTGNPPFFGVTKRLHHALHGSPGDGSALDGEARAIYEDTSRENLRALEVYVRPGDIALLHDPQTAGLAVGLAAMGLLVLWRCHIGHDQPSAEADRGWGFLLPYLGAASAYVFSREAYRPGGLDPGRSHVIQPSIDAMSPKNQPLDPAGVRAIVQHIGVAAAGGSGPGAARFLRADGTVGQIIRRADILRHGPAPSADTPLVLQVSRWDPLKDMPGVMHGFAALCADGRAGAAHLLLAGPDVRGVADDPEAPAVYAATAAAWRALPEPCRSRIALCMLPTDDVEENAVIVNALQRHATIVTQKSLHEGFGLTVTEAMWKGRPVIASAVGGIQDQIEHRVHGLLLPDPTDLAAFGDAVAELLADPDAAARYGAAAHERVRQQFLGIRHLLQYADLLQKLDGAPPPAPA